MAQPFSAWEVSTSSAALSSCMEPTVRARVPRGHPDADLTNLAIRMLICPEVFRCIRGRRQLRQSSVRLAASRFHHSIRSSFGGRMPSSVKAGSRCVKAGNRFVGSPCQGSANSCRMLRRPPNARSASKSEILRATCPRAVCGSPSCTDPIVGVISRSDGSPACRMN